MPSQSINLYNLLAKKKQFKKTVNFDLKRIKDALNKLGNPERKLKNVINVIGSDGKYSVLNSLKYFIEENKQTTSAYISPSLKDIKERFWMGSDYLSYDKIKKTNHESIPLAYSPSQSEEAQKQILSHMLQAKIARKEIEKNLSKEFTD